MKVFLSLYPHAQSLLLEPPCTTCKYHLVQHSALYLMEISVHWLSFEDFIQGIKCSNHLEQY